MEEWKEDRTNANKTTVEAEKSRETPENGGKVIFQRFRRDAGRYPYPYPPVYREPDTDYLCFTADEEVNSGSWEIRPVESLEQEVLEPYLAGYADRFELKQEQIQMGPLFEPGGKENLVTVPALEELPMVKLDLSHFEPTADEEGRYICRKNPVYQKGKYKGRPLLLTIGVPVSNQIGTIDRCLSHIKPLLDKLDAELVVIDTGSTDGTIEVCKSYGARVYEHPWHDNMSAARNEAIYHARGLWYMSIDDDEWFEDVEDILRFFQTGAYRKYRYATYIQRNYTDSQGEIYQDYHTYRMAEITPELHFEGRIHDSLQVDLQVGIAQLLSYAHHYGFVMDEPNRIAEKFVRNASILLQDVYEYPEDLRYLFQLANEYRVVQRPDVALRLFAQKMALAKASGEADGGDSVVQCLSCLYELSDRRLFQWALHLVGLFPLADAERACIAWCQEKLSFKLEEPAGKVLAYYEEYEKFLSRYQENPSESQKTTYYGLIMVESEIHIAEARAIGFCAYLRTGEEGKALALLDRFSLEKVRSHRFAVLSEGLAAGEAVYRAVCGKLTAVQWEEWTDSILDIFSAGLTRSRIQRRMAARFPEVFSRISVSPILSWLGRSWVAANERVREKLADYALESVEGGRIFAEETPVQELALCARVLKEAYVKAHGSKQASREPGTEGNPNGNLNKNLNRNLNIEAEDPGSGLRLLKAYILAEGAFAERYYSPELLMDSEGTALRPDIRAACLMASALADGRANSENVALLKQALAVYPPFHEEVRSILKELR